MRRLLFALAAVGCGMLPLAAATPAGATTGSAATTEITDPFPVAPFCVYLIVPVGPITPSFTVCTPWN